MAYRPQAAAAIINNNGSGINGHKRSNGGINGRKRRNGGIYNIKRNMA